MLLSKLPRSGEAVFSKCTPGKWRPWTTHCASWHFIYWKRHLQKDSLQPRFKGPYQVLLTDPFAAKLQAIDSWIHMTHVKKKHLILTKNAHHLVTRRWKCHKTDAEYTWGDSFPMFRPGLLDWPWILIQFIVPEFVTYGLGCIIDKTFCSSFF